MLDLSLAVNETLKDWAELLYYVGALFSFVIAAFSFSTQVAYTQLTHASDALSELSQTWEEFFRNLGKLDDPWYSDEFYKFLMAMDRAALLADAGIMPWRKNRHLRRMLKQYYFSLLEVPDCRNSIKASFDAGEYIFLAEYARNSVKSKLAIWELCLLTLLFSFVGSVAVYSIVLEMSK